MHETVYPSPVLYCHGLVDPRRCPDHVCPLVRTMQIRRLGDLDYLIVFQLSNA
jgi:hypothetical protein